MALLQNLGKWEYRIVIALSKEATRRVQDDPDIWDSADDLHELSKGLGLSDLSDFLERWKEYGFQSRRLLENHYASELIDLELTAIRNEWPPENSLTSYWLLGFDGQEELARRFTRDLYMRRRHDELPSLAGVNAVPGQFNGFSKLQAPVRIKSAEDQELIDECLAKMLPRTGSRGGSGNSVSFCERYREAGHLGLNVEHAWKQGFHGEGIKLVDVESAWDRGHPELADAKVQLIYNEIRKSANLIDHGTQTLGVVTGKSELTGLQGVSPELDWVGFASHYCDQVRENTAEVWDIAGAIVASIPRLRPGGILLIEAQVHEITKAYDTRFPIEVVQPFFDAIRIAAGNGVIVVEPAANGSWDLDAGFAGTQYEDNQRSLSVSRGESFRDSGAIMVGACWPGRNVADPQSNWGSRVDCFAWGSRIRTIEHPHVSCCDGDPDPDPQRCHFSETSGASALIAGAAALVQQMAIEYLGSPLTPKDMRDILSNEELGTKCRGERAIGVMPDLGKIEKRLKTEGIRNLKKAGAGIRKAPLSSRVH